MPGIRPESVRSLFIEMLFQETVLSSGTAFVINTNKGPYLLTNRHNVTGRNQDTGQPLSSTGGIPDAIVITHHKRGILGQFVKRKQLLLRDECPLWVEHPLLGSKADFVALPITETHDVDLHPHTVSAEPSRVLFGPSDILSVIGFPFGLKASGGFGVWSSGFVASEPEVDYNDLPVLLIDCRSRQGQSGSPVIIFRRGGGFSMRDGSTPINSGAQSELVGIYSGRIHKDSDIGMVWKSKAIKELITHIEYSDAQKDWIITPQTTSTITNGGTLNWQHAQPSNANVKATYELHSPCDR